MTTLDPLSLPIVAGIRLQRNNGYWSVLLCIDHDPTVDHPHFEYVGCRDLTECFAKIRDHIDACHALKLNLAISEIVSQPMKGNS